MNIQHEQGEKDGVFFLTDDDNQRVAELTYYFVDPNTINANHTYVSEHLRGQGVADKLYGALRAFITERQLTLIPGCSYIAKKWEKETR